ncbi:MAG: hypothetical protein C4333_09320 [Meiothermus sp.]
MRSSSEADFTEGADFQRHPIAPDRHLASCWLAEVLALEQDIAVQRDGDLLTPGFDTQGVPAGTKVDRLLAKALLWRPDVDRWIAIPFQTASVVASIATPDHDAEIRPTLRLFEHTELDFDGMIDNTRGMYRRFGISGKSPAVVAQHWTINAPSIRKRGPR